MARKYYTSTATIHVHPVTKQRYFNLYVVVDHEGELKSSGARIAVYKSYKRACMNARDEGDSVMEVEVNLSKAPMFIHKKVV